MIITFNDASTLEAVSVRITSQDALAVITRSSSETDLAEIFRDSAKTKRMIVKDASGVETAYEGYTTFDAMIKYASGAFGVVMYKPEETPEAKAEVQLAAIKVAQIQAQALDDKQALEVQAIFPVWSGDGITYAVDFKVLEEGILYKCLQEHVSQESWHPSAAPSLWAKVLIPDPEVIPVWEQPDSANAYMTGDKVHYPTADDPVYESLIDNNVWSPADYPAGWQQVE